MIRERFELNGKVVLVVGGGGLLGRRFAAACREYGADVVSADLAQASRAASSDQSDMSAPDEVVRLEVDITDEASADAMVDEVMDRFGRIDVLIYSVTTKPDDFYKPYTECSLEGWRAVLSAELDGAFLATQRVGRMMEQAERGSIILISSMYGLVGNDQRIYEGSNLAELYAGADGGTPGRIYSHGAYNTAKGGLIALARYLAAYWGHAGIRVNCVSPGGVGHPGENEEFLARYSARVPLGRKAGLDEISAAVVFLASDAASYVTGHNLVVDGGWTAW